mgnify:CR=1 FL=1
MQYEKNPKTGEDLHFNEEVIKDGLDHKTIKRFAYIKHNKDSYTIEEEKQGKGKAGELKNDHWHVVLECPGKVDINCKGNRSSNRNRDRRAAVNL